MWFALLAAASASVLDICREGLTERDAQTCEKALAERPDAELEARACFRLESPAHKVECVTRMKEARHPPHELINACVDTLGPGIDALRCYTATVEARSQPLRTIAECDVMGTPADELACIRRFRHISWPGEPVMTACKRWDDPEACMAGFVRTEEGRGADHVPTFGAIDMCYDSFDKDTARLTCLTGSSRDAVFACGRFAAESHRKECHKRLKSKRFPGPDIINGCVDLVGDGVDGLRCLTALEDVDTPMAPDFEACGMLDVPKQRIACMARFREIGWDARPAVEGCKLYADPVACLRAIGMGGDVAPSFIGLNACREAFPEVPADAVSCVRKSRKADDAWLKKLESCQREAPDARLACLDG